MAKRGDSPKLADSEFEASCMGAADEEDDYKNRRQFASRNLFEDSLST